jgi:hypothetical protein
MSTPTSNDWEQVELALSSTNAVERMGLPYDPANRRLFGVPIASTISETAGWSMCWASRASSLGGAADWPRSRR